MHGHDINELREKNGFLIVYKQNAGFPVEQVQIDKNDFINWFKESAENLCVETLQNIEKSVKKSKEPQIYLFYVPINGRNNFEIAMNNGVWGFTGGDKKTTRGLEKIMQMKKGDILVFVREWKADQEGVTGRPPREKYIGTYIESNWYYKEYSIDEKGVVEKDKMCSNGVKSGNLTINPALKKEKDLEPTEFNITCNSDSDNVLRIGGWSDNHWTPVGKYYYAKIYNNSNEIIFNGIPCYRKDDNKIGLYDLIERNFYTNQGTGNFSKGKDM